MLIKLEKPSLSMPGPTGGTGAQRNTNTALASRTYCLVGEADRGQEVTTQVGGQRCAEGCSGNRGVQGSSRVGLEMSPERCTGSGQVKTGTEAERRRAGEAGARAAGGTHMVKHSWAPGRGDGER